MNLLPSEDARMIGQVAARFLQDHAATALPTDDPAALWSDLAAMGWLALPFDEAQGGLGADNSMLAALFEAMGAARLNAPYLPLVWAASLLTGIQAPVVLALCGQIAAGTRTVAVAENIAAVRLQDGYRLDGTAVLVLGGDTADVLLVPATLDGAMALFVAATDQPGLRVTPVTTVDGRGAADIVFDSVELPAASLLAQGALQPAWTAAADRCSALLCADACGAASALLDRTSNYTRTRWQFGRALRAFQVVDHLVGEMLTALEEARAATQMALAALAAPYAKRRRAVSAARVRIAAAGHHIGHTAIQLHGAMGVTEELDVGQYLKRLLATHLLFGTPDAHLACYARLAKAGITQAYLASPPHAGQPTIHGQRPDLTLDTLETAFQTDIAGYLDDAMPSSIATAQRLAPGVYADPDIGAAWQSIVHAKGYAAPNWPETYGGTGWSPVQRYIWAHEACARFAPVSSAIGLSLVGPVLFQFGTPAQQQRYLPGIVSGAEIWCQGFSEPGAGSDLAALSTRALREGDEYVVNGSKIWTTHGHVARFMAALVRTGGPGGRRDGISFLIIDMQSPGLTVRPIITIGGDHDVNQIFFDDVRVTVANRLGDEGQGWAIAKFLLEYERGGEIMSAGHRALMGDIRRTAIERAQGDAFWNDFAHVAIDIDVLEMLELRSLLNVAPHPALPSILKLRASEIQQAVTELGVRALGADALRWNARRPLHADPAARIEDSYVPRYLNSRATTIFGGAREIQKGLIAKAVA